MPPGAITARLSVPIPGYPANDYFYQYGPLFGDMRCTNPANPNDPSLVLWKVSTRQGMGPAPIRNSNRGISATRSWACPMAAPFSSSATRARRCPRRRRTRSRLLPVLRQSGDVQPPGHNGRPVPIRQPERPDVGEAGDQPEVSSSSGSMLISGMAAGATVAAAAEAVATVAAAAVRAVRRRHMRFRPDGRHEHRCRLTTFPPAPAAAGCVWTRDDDRGQLAARAQS